jgi:hypothetical protein
LSLGIGFTLDRRFHANEFAGHFLVPPDRLKATLGEASRKAVASFPVPPEDTGLSPGNFTRCLKVTAADDSFFS